MNDDDNRTADKGDEKCLSKTDTGQSALKNDIFIAKYTIEEPISYIAVKIQIEKEP